MELLRTQQMLLLARVAATTVKTTPIDPARDVIRMKAGIHGTERSKGCQALQADFFIFFCDHNRSAVLALLHTR
jgi:hypothetical protein